MMITLHFYLTKLYNDRLFTHMFTLWYYFCLNKGFEYFVHHCVRRTEDVGSMIGQMFCPRSWTVQIDILSLWGVEDVRWGGEGLGNHADGAAPWSAAKRHGNRTQREGKMIIILAWQGRWVIQVIWVLPPRDYVWMCTDWSHEEGSA